MNRGGKTRTFQKPKNRKYVLKRLWNYLYHYKWLLLLAIVLTLLSNAFALIGPSLLGKAIDAVYSAVGCEECGIVVVREER